MAGLKGKLWCTTKQDSQVSCSGQAGFAGENRTILSQQFQLLQSLFLKTRYSPDGRIQF